MRQSTPSSGDVAHTDPLPTASAFSPEAGTRTRAVTRSLREVLVHEVGERRSTSDGKRVPQQPARSLRLAGLEPPATLGRKPLESIDIELVPVDLDNVRAPPRHQDVVVQHLPQLRDVHVDRLHRRRRRVVPPEVGDETIDRDGLSPIDEQQGEERALLCGLR